MLHGFYHRRQQAWDRIYELEERAETAVPPPDPARMMTLIQAGDADPIGHTTAERQQAQDERRAAIVEAPRARRRAMLQFELPTALPGWLILAAIPAINALWLAALGVDYFEWYLQSGFLVALLFGVVAVAIRLDSHPDLIAAQPIFYLAGVLDLFSELAAALRNLFAWPRSDRALAEAGLPGMAYRFRVRTFDLALNLFFGWSCAAAFVAWAVLVAPLQYWLNLVCGAPAREALASSQTLWVVRGAKGTERLFASKNPDEFQRQRRELKEAHDRGEMTEIGFAEKPVSFTAAIAAAVLFGISQLA